MMKSSINVFKPLIALFICTYCLYSFASEFFVSINHPAAQDTGRGGSAAPYKTIAYAMSKLQPGDTLTIEQGVYREAIVFPQRTWGLAQTTIQGQGDVVIKGSIEVQGWRSMGDGLYVKPWMKEPAQVFVSGRPLQQIGGTIFGGFPTKVGHALSALHQSQKGIWPGRKEGNEEHLPANSFYYKADTLALYMKLAGNDTPDNQTVEVSTQTYGMFGKDVAGVTVKNLRFEHGNTSAVTRSALVTMIGQKITLDNIHVKYADSTAIELIGDDNVLKNSSANFSGQLGLRARGERVQLLNNETSNNNTRGFNKWWEAGGAKFVGAGGLQNSVISGHKAFSNTGDGIWFDWKNKNNRIEKSIVAYNTGMGIHYEASGQAIIENNIVLGNGQRGIYLMHSSDCIVAFNLVASNGLQGIVAMEEGGRDKDEQFDFSAKGNAFVGNVIAWNDGALFLPPEQANNKSDGNVFIGSNAQNRVGLGWSKYSSEKLSEWSKRTGLDTTSTSVTDKKIDDGFLKSMTDKTHAPDMHWYEALHKQTKIVRIDPAIAKLLTDPRDRQAGPTL